MAVERARLAGDLIRLHREQVGEQTRRVPVAGRHIGSGEEHDACTPGRVPGCDLCRQAVSDGKAHWARPGDAEHRGVTQVDERGHLCHGGVLAGGGAGAHDSRGLCGRAEA